jgi:HK97 family phage portal protein
VGFWDFLSRPQPVAFFTPNVTHIGAGDMDTILLGDLTPAQMWATQPHLRTVVSFLARNIAQLGLHTFERDGEDRKRDRTSPFATTMRRPNEDQTAFDLVYGLVGDLSLYDRAYWMTIPDADSPSGWTFRRLPPPWVTVIPRDVFGAKAYRVLSPEGKSVDVNADQILAFTGYHPSNPRKGSPTIEALRETLQEQIEAGKYRNQVWKRGGRVSAVIERPKDAPQWSPEAMEQFREDWYSKYTGNGPKAGGTPILEDGMKLQRIDFSASEQQFVEAAKLSFSTVAAAFHVNPTMVGILDNANYSNVREFRRMLYGDTLGPLIAQIEDRINTFLLPRMGMDNAAHYAEFNIAEKLQGSFEEQAAVMQTLVGAPLMTRNEGRSKFNLPAIEGGDALVTPLNVLIGGQASATDSGSQNLEPKSRDLVAERIEATNAKLAEVNAKLSHLGSDIGAEINQVAAKAHRKSATDPQREKVAEVLATFFARQGKSVLSAIGADRDWWDEKRWDGELSDDLFRVTHTLADLLGKSEAERLGYADGYDADQTLKFLRAVADRRAKAINETTKAQVEAAIANPDSDPAQVFQTATDSRAAGVGSLVATAVAGFAIREAGHQIAQREGVTPTKTWVVNSKSPRSSHSSMNGETVPIDEPFSNGMQFPGDYGDADEVAGCQCSIVTSIS